MMSTWQPVEGDDLVGGKAAEIHRMGRVRLGHGEVGQVDLVEFGVVHRPEHVAPGPVQRVGGLVALREPVAEGLRWRPGNS